MAIVFDIKNHMKSAENWLWGMCQGNREVAKFASEFQHLVADTKWNEAVHGYHFRYALSKEIKDELGQVELPPNLDAFVKLCISTDGHLTECRWGESQVPDPLPHSHHRGQGRSAGFSFASLMQRKTSIMFGTYACIVGNLATMMWDAL